MSSSLSGFGTFTYFPELKTGPDWEFLCLTVCQWLVIQLPLNARHLPNGKCPQMYCGTAGAPSWEA